MSQPNTTGSQVPAPNPQARYDDEIDLAELFGHIWRTKWRVMIALLTVASLYVTFQAIKFVVSDRAITYSHVFDLTFEGLQDGKFPDGSPFLMSDIVSPTVLNRVYINNKLESYGITLDQFRRAVTIEPYSPEAVFIRQRFQQRLGERNLSPADIQTLQERMRSELHRAQSAAVRIGIAVLPEHSIPSNVIQKILLDIPGVWASRAIEERGVLRLSLPIYSPRIFNDDRFNELDYLIGIEMLLENIALVQGNVRALQALPGAANAKDPETGFNLQDLQKTISDVAAFDLRQLMDPVRELGISRNPQLVELYYTQQLRELEREKNLWEERAKFTRQIITGFARDEMPAGDPTQVVQGTVTPQLGDAFLDRLVEISRHGSGQEFRQELTEKVLGYQNKALDIQHRMNIVESILEAIGRDHSAGQADLRSIYVKEVQKRLPVVLKSLRDYTSVVNHLHEQLSRQATGSISEIIQPQGGTFESRAPRPVGGQDLLYFVALMVATGFISLFGCLIYDMVRRREPGTDFKSVPLL